MAIQLIPPPEPSRSLATQLQELGVDRTGIVGAKAVAAATALEGALPRSGKGQLPELLRKILSLTRSELPNYLSQFGELIESRRGSTPWSNGTLLQLVEVVAELGPQGKRLIPGLLAFEKNRRANGGSLLDEHDLTCLAETARRSIKAFEYVVGQQRSHDDDLPYRDGWIEGDPLIRGFQDLWRLDLRSFFGERDDKALLTGEELRRACADCEAAANSTDPWFDTKKYLRSLGYRITPEMDQRFATLAGKPVSREGKLLIEVLGRQFKDRPESLLALLASVPSPQEHDSFPEAESFRIRWTVKRAEAGLPTSLAEQLDFAAAIREIASLDERSVRTRELAAVQVFAHQRHSRGGAPLGVDDLRLLKRMASEVGKTPEAWTETDKRNALCYAVLTLVKLQSAVAGLPALDLKKIDLIAQLTKSAEPGIRGWWGHGLTYCPWVKALSQYLKNRSAFPSKQEIRHLKQHLWTGVAGFEGVCLASLEQLADLRTRRQVRKYEPEVTEAFSELKNSWRFMSGDTLKALLEFSIGEKQDDLCAALRSAASLPKAIGITDEVYETAEHYRRPDGHREIEHRVETQLAGALKNLQTALGPQANIEEVVNILHQIVSLAKAQGCRIDEIKIQVAPATPT